MWESEHKESWVPKNWCFWTVVLENSLESPLDCKEINPVNPKGNQSWIFIGRTDAEAEAPILRSPDAKNWLIVKKPWCWERLNTRGEGGNRGWDGWMASLTQWTWVWASSSSWCWTGKHGVLQSMVLQTVGHDWATKLTNTTLDPRLDLLHQGSQLRDKRKLKSSCCLLTSGEPVITGPPSGRVKFTCKKPHAGYQWLIILLSR